LGEEVLEEESSEKTEPGKEGASDKADKLAEETDNLKVDEDVRT
jgi:hypothetical protein